MEAMAEPRVDRADHRPDRLTFTSRRGHRASSASFVTVAQLRVVAIACNFRSKEAVVEFRLAVSGRAMENTSRPSTRSSSGPAVERFDGTYPRRVGNFGQERDVQPGGIGDGSQERIDALDAGELICCAQQHCDVEAKITRDLPRLARATATGLLDRC